VEKENGIGQRVEENGSVYIVLRHMKEIVLNRAAQEGVEMEELEELAKKFIIGYTPLTAREKELYRHIAYIEEQIRLIDMRRRRLLDVWKAISVKLAAQRK
jgi:hypothetical protein